jgi:hypothetical protein
MPRISGSGHNRMDAGLFTNLSQPLPLIRFESNNNMNNILLSSEDRNFQV